MNRESKRNGAREEARSEQAVPAGASEPVTRGRTSPAQFLREVRSELKKVNWPTRPELINYTMVVLVTTIVLTLLVWGMDWVISNAIINILS